MTRKKRRSKRQAYASTTSVVPVCPEGKQSLLKGGARIAESRSGVSHTPSSGRGKASKRK